MKIVKTLMQVKYQNCLMKNMCYHMEFLMRTSN